MVFIIQVRPRFKKLKKQLAQKTGAAMLAQRNGEYGNFYAYEESASVC